MHHRTLCLTYHTMFDKMLFLKNFVEHVSAAPSLLIKNKETCARHSAEAKRPHALLLHRLRSHMLTNISRPTCHFAWHADPALSYPTITKKKKRKWTEFCHLFWCVRCALACVIKTKSEHVNLMELLSESASFCIGPECPSSPIRRPKKKANLVCLDDS